jgi:DNA-binding GntR family transcriptional regulator
MMSETLSADSPSNSGHEGTQSIRGKRPEEQLLYDRLVDAIIDKTLRPGQHLNEAKLAASYAVPRSRVRRVLERLRDEAVVEFHLNRGAFISRPTVEEAIAVFEARRHLDAVILRLACARATSDDIERLRRHVKIQHDVFDNLRPEMNRVAGEFHLLVAKAGGNEVLALMLKLLMRRVCLIQSLYEKRSGVLCLVHEHERLVDLIAANDPDGAVNEAMKHCDHIEASLDLSERRRSEIDIYELP